MNILNQYGWQRYCQATTISTDKQPQTARIISVRGTTFSLMTEAGPIPGELTGKLLFSLSNAEQPKVGDWVNYMDFGDQAIITEVLPRNNELYRKRPGSESGRQVMAANVDAMVIVQGLDRDFNLMRLERYIVQSIACNIRPMVILNKTDLVDHPEDYIHEVQRLQRDIQVFTISAIHGNGLGTIMREVFKKAHTYLIMGSSGAGKSTLINALKGEEVQDTQQLSGLTHKGRHTTTTRDMIQMPDGSLIIDTPGMREFGISFEDEGQNGMFPAIEALASQCKYSDCSHINEKDCAVIDAFKTGGLDAVIYNSYLKMMREQHHYEQSVTDKKREGKRFGKMVREAKAYRKKYKR